MVFKLALFAIREILEKDLKCLLYGQDVGGRLGGVFREARQFELEKSILREDIEEI